MRDFIIRRLLLLIPVFFGVSILVFTLSHVVGDPAAVYVTERTTERQIQKIYERYHLNDPLYVQYFYWLWGIFQGDWGVSRSGGAEIPVTEAIRLYFSATFELTIIAMIFGIVMGIPIGIISAVKKDRAPDHFSRVFALSGVSIPIFWLGLLLQFLLFYQLKVRGLPHFPLEGRVDYFIARESPIQSVTGFYLVDSLIAGNTDFFFSALSHLVLPAFCLAYLNTAYITRITRSSMLEVMRQDYITLARSKGLSERIVVYKHALRNALIPTTTMIGLIFGSLLAGAVLTETVFAWPGLGRWATLAILTADFASIMGFVILIAVIYVLVNLLVDVLYGAIDPRIRYG
ncbi:MAG: ABC transporter permease [Candidatus Bathyarchaeia archaeon]